jgi:mannose/cellobiose epimerase-like protein (N-acyl-D-glucosamine 2-epimerase family)
MDREFTYVMTNQCHTGIFAFLAFAMAATAANPDAVTAIRHAATNRDSAARGIANLALWKLETADATTNLHE